MRLYIFLVSAFLAVLLLGNPTHVIAGDDYPDSMNRENNAVRETSPSETFSLKQSVPQRHPAKPFEMTAVDYCYRGSIMDPVTGEMVDLFVMCTEGEIGHGLDIA
ncbi:MAG TPA: hypothetical protein VGK77_24160 [Candidatus Binatia bacterium]|jgi:hypothetical protein